MANLLDLGEGRLGKRINQRAESLLNPVAKFFDELTAPLPPVDLPAERVSGKITPSFRADPRADMKRLFEEGSIPGGDMSGGIKRAPRAADEVLKRLMEKTGKNTVTGSQLERAVNNEETRLDLVDTIVGLGSHDVEEVFVNEMRIGSVKGGDDLLQLSKAIREIAPPKTLLKRQGLPSINEFTPMEVEFPARVRKMIEGDIGSKEERLLMLMSYEEAIGDLPSNLKRAKDRLTKSLGDLSEDELVKRVYANPSPNFDPHNTGREF